MYEEKECMLNDVMERLGDQLVRLCYTYVRDWQTAEDLAQETFLRFYRAYGNFRGEAALETYVYRIAAAEFEGARYGLARLDDGRLVLDSFYLEKDDYLLKGSSITQADSVMTHSVQSEADRYKRTVGIADNSGISKYELLDTETGESYSIDVDPHKANIYQLTVPRDMNEMEIHIYDEQGRIEQ